MADFFDIFHHRVISLLYLAWKKYRLSENYRRDGNDRISKMFLSLIGLGTAGMKEMAGLPPEPLIFYSGLLSRPMPCAFAIESAVRYFSDAPAEVHQFIDRLVRIDPEDQTQLGTANGSIGIDAVCGSQAWENQTKFRIHLGPVGYERFIRFMPSGDMLDPVFCLVRYMAGIEYEFEVKVFLKKEEVPSCTLGLGAADAPRLGWSTWIKAADFMHEQDPCVTYQEPQYKFVNGRRIKPAYAN